MKVVVAMDSFKGSMTAVEGCDAVEAGIKQSRPLAEVIKVPMADGGEGTVQSLVACTGGTIYEAMVTGPLGKPVHAFYGILGDGVTAVIEMAAASGLPLVPQAQRNPLLTTTRGTGELILKALDRGCKHLMIGIGGSATNDGGAGMAQALGVRFLDRTGNALDLGGGALADMERIDVSALDPRLDKVTCTILCDVDNPLYGPNGAAAVYGPQKGATPAMVAKLDEALRHYAGKLHEQLDKDVAQVPGAGAAGGLGAGLLAFLNARMERGIKHIIEAAGLPAKLAGAAYCITGEGRIDGQTVYGKTPMGVAKVAKQHGATVIALAGSVGKDAEQVHPHGIDAVFSILPYPISLEQAMEPANAQAFLKAKAAELFRLLN